MRQRSSFTVVPVLALVVVLLVGIGAWFYFARATETGGGLNIGGPFALENGAGQTVTDRDMRGRYMLVYFGYTFCPDICPTTLNEVATALDKLGPAANRLQVVFISVDPQRDTPKVVHDYAAAFSPRIMGLTGTPAEIAKVAREYRVYYAKHPSGDAASDYTVDHSSILYLMDPEGHFIAPIRTDESGEAMAADISKRMT